MSLYKHTFFGGTFFKWLVSWVKPVFWCCHLLSESSSVYFISCWSFTVYKNAFSMHLCLIMFLPLLVSLCSRCIFTPYPSRGSSIVPVWVWSPKKKPITFTVTSGSMAANQAWQLLQQVYVHEKIIQPQCYLWYKQICPLSVCCLAAPPVEFDQINMFSLLFGVVVFLLDYLCGVFTVTAEELWRGVLAETSPRNKKGRGKRGKRRLRNDLNRGQRIGEGLTSYVLFPSCLCWDCCTY